MLSLTKELENKLRYKGKEYKLDLAFDVVLRWYELLEDPEMSSAEKLMTAFRMFLPGVETTDGNFIVEAVEHISKYVAETPYGNYDDETADDTSDEDPIKYYSYQQDAGIIYASFLQDYGIDLIDQQGKLHWDKFRALLDGLSDKTPFQKVVQIRMTDTSKLEGEELNHMIELQDYYQLDSMRSVKNQNQGMNDFFNALVQTSK